MGRKFLFAWALLACPIISLSGETAQAAKPTDVTLHLSPESPTVNFLDFYENLRQSGEPVLLTADSALWSLHALDDQTRAGAEAEDLLPRLTLLFQVLDTAFTRLRSDAGQTRLPEKLVDPARRAHLFVKTARALAEEDPKTSPEIESELERIGKRDGWAMSDVFNRKFNYAAMGPRGRQSRTSRLARYHATSAWLERSIFRLDETHPSRAGGDPNQNHPNIERGWFAGIDMGELERSDPRAIARLEARYPAEGLAEMRAAAIFSILLLHTSAGFETTLMDISKEIDAMETAWRGPVQHMDASNLLSSLSECMTTPWSVDNALAFLNDDYDMLLWIGWLRARLVGPRHDASGLGRIGFSFLGERPSIDSRILDQMSAGPEWQGVYVTERLPAISDESPDARLGQTRRLPHGLDLMAAMSNPAARRLLLERGETRYVGFNTRLRDAREIWHFSPAENNKRSINEMMLHAAAEISGSSRLKNSPAYVAQPEHEWVRLNAGLAFWASVRRADGGAADASASEPQSSLPGRPASALPVRAQGTPLGYIDPFPDLYAQIERTAQGIDAALALSRPIEDPLRGNAREIASLMRSLEEMSRKQTKNPASLDLLDYSFIRH